MEHEINMTHSPSTKTTLAVLFGGRSGEHEVSLMSARSVLSVLDRTRYNVIEVGITHDGAWLAGQDGLAAFEQGKTEALLPASLHPDPSRPRPLRDTQTCPEHSRRDAIRKIRRY